MGRILPPLDPNDDYCDTRILLGGRSCLGIWMLQIRRCRFRLSKTRLRAPRVWLRHRGLAHDDVFIAAYPRSGSTWLRFMLFDILTGATAEFDAVNRAIPDVGKHRSAPVLVPGGGRLVKTQEPRRDDYAKAVYLVRDPRDVALSEHRFQRWARFSDEDWGPFLRGFLRGRANGYGSWLDHVRSWLGATAKGGAQVHLIRYEDVRRDTEEALSRILYFLDVRVGGAVIRRAIRDNSLERMRAKEDGAGNGLLRGTAAGFRFVENGRVEGWRDKLTVQEVAMFEEHAGDVLAMLGYPRA